jgi:acetoin utilization deacetylase AcuC-like enzyme
MRGVFDPRQLLHAPAEELHNGAMMPYSETPARAQSIAQALGPLEPATDHGEAPLAAVHDPAYLDFLKTAHARWTEAGRPGDAIAYTFPVVARREVGLQRIDALMGRYSFDASTPITAHTWEAANASAQSALTALDIVAGGDRSAFALCRPPGHHAGPDYCGGYCYINSAAVAAQAAIDSGAVRRVAVLDLDYHHGNGTQDIFWRRGDVLYASIHADPATDYPFYWGHADERGEGEGEDATLNLPLPQGSGLDAFRRALAQALAAVARFAPDLLVVSYGADTWEADPISHFRLTTADYAVLAADIAACRWPTLVVMEGGYAVDAVGTNAASFLAGW